MICIYYSKWSLIALQREDAWAEFGAALAVGFDCRRVLLSATVNSGKQWSPAISNKLCSVTKAATIKLCGMLLICKSILFKRRRHHPFKHPKRSQQRSELCFAGSSSYVQHLCYLVFLCMASLAMAVENSLDHPAPLMEHGHYQRFLTSLEPNYQYWLSG